MFAKSLLSKIGFSMILGVVAMPLSSHALADSAQCASTRETLRALSQTSYSPNDLQIEAVDGRFMYNTLNISLKGQSVIRLHSSSSDIDGQPLNLEIKESRGQMPGSSLSKLTAQAVLLNQKLDEAKRNGQAVKLAGFAKIADESYCYRPGSNLFVIIDNLHELVDIAE